MTKGDAGEMGEMRASPLDDVTARVPSASRLPLPKSNQITSNAAISKTSQPAPCRGNIPAANKVIKLIKQTSVRQSGQIAKCPRDARSEISEPRVSLLDCCLAVAMFVLPLCAMLLYYY